MSEHEGIWIEYRPTYADHWSACKRMGDLVRCRDCKHATISSLGFCKYCEKFVLPDEDGFGPDPRVNLPLDFFCAYGERRKDQ